jgi:4-hydroxy-tetrahydrodipicolinate reductase
MIRLAVAGACGRTGSSVLRQAVEDGQFDVVAALSTRDDPLCGSTVAAGQGGVEIASVLDVPCDVLIDFTLPEGTMTWLEVCVARRLAMVIGATGYDEAQLEMIRQAAKTVPIVMASNFSLGINVLLDVVGRVARDLGPGYDVEIIEAHHRHKLDAPSGTARAFVEAVRSTREDEETSQIVYGRHGQTGERQAGEIGVHAVRMGELIGRHEIHFSGAGETITLKHTAHSRDTFAAGALRAARWVVGKPAGLYSMRQVMR